MDKNKNTSYSDHYIFGYNVFFYESHCNRKHVCVCAVVHVILPFNWLFAAYDKTALYRVQTIYFFSWCSPSVLLTFIVSIPSYHSISLSRLNQVLLKWENTPFYCKQWMATTANLTCHTIQNSRKSVKKKFLTDF